MSEQDLYDIARQRVDRRNRRWTLWAFNLAGLIMTVAGLVLVSDTPYETVGVAVMLAWAGAFVLHTIITVMAHQRDEDIGKEIARLREAAYEKPKRLKLTEDGEIEAYADWEEEEAEHSHKS
jgi:hypothetical protein